MVPSAITGGVVEQAVARGTARVSGAEDGPIGQDQLPQQLEVVVARLVTDTSPIIKSNQ